MNFPQTVEELLHWPVTTGEDSFGTYHVITGFEGTGGCFWCGESLNDKRRRFCGHRSGHWTLYANHFYWTYARSACLNQYEYRCANCGGKKEGRGYYAISSLEAHHIIPLEGDYRAVSSYNVPWNLIALCHQCHLLIAAAMRPPRVNHNSKADPWLEAEKAGQAVMSLSL